MKRTTIFKKAHISPFFVNCLNMLLLSVRLTRFEHRKLVPPYFSTKTEKKQRGFLKPRVLSTFKINISD